MTKILSNRIAVVTGAGQGIGKACALQISNAGATVIAVDINEENLNATVNLLNNNGGSAHAIKADLGNVSEIDCLINEIIQKFGKIDILVNNAGVTRRAEFMDLTEQDWDAIFRVNAKGAFFCLQRVAKEMISNGGGRIINIASIAGKGYAGTSNAIYASSKGAVISLTKTAAQQLGPFNINVNSVCPGIVRTTLYQKMVEVMAKDENMSVEAVEARAVSEIPLRRANEPEDIAEMVVFLASPGSRNITGQSFNVDGGLVPD